MMRMSVLSSICATTGSLPGNCCRLFHVEYAAQLKGSFLGEYLGDNSHFVRILGFVGFVKKIATRIGNILPRHGETPICQRRDAQRDFVAYVGREVVLSHF